MITIRSRVLALALAMLASAAALADVERSAELRRGALAPRIAAGGGHGCVIRGDGGILCWGQNNSGQLGNGRRSSRSAPALVPIGDRGLAVAAGSAHTCAVVTPNREVQCWGSNKRGQLGIGSTNDALQARTVSKDNLDNHLPQSVGVAAGDQTTCAVYADGTLRCWGNNSSGQLGDGTTTNQLRPQLVSGSQDFIAVTVGSSHACGIRSNGRLACWGSNANGQLGDGTTTQRLLPIAVPGLTNVIAVAASTSHTCALRGNGALSCWGANAVGQVGNGTTTSPVLSPVQVATNIAAIAEIAGGSTCAVGATGAVQCWGLNDVGQLGDGKTRNRSVPTNVANLNGVVVELAAGSVHACALLVNGKVACWGGNGSGQLGSGSGASSAVEPQLVLGVSGSASARRISAGGNTSCALRHSGTAACWGNGESGQIGDANSVDGLVPRNLVLLPLARSIEVGTSHGCVVLANGAVRCWGANASGQLGNGANAGSNVPVVVLDLNDAVGVSAGASHTCALRVNGNVRCWGVNESGQLGNGTTAASNRPVNVRNISQTVGVTTGSRHSCALRADGSVRCWGANDFGQLGNGGNAPSSRAVKVSNLEDAVALTAGVDHTCAERVDGTIHCWGRNEDGQLGDGTLSARNAPVVVQGTGITRPTYLSAGAFFTCAESGQTRICWGANGAGQFGFGSLEPAALSAEDYSSTGVRVGTGATHICHATSAGRVFCSGANADGQLGLGTTAPSVWMAEVASFDF